ncbi:MAG: hypothetical protein ACO1OB_30005 [Archangium sp.]
MFPALLLLTLVAAPEARLEYRVQAGVKGCPDENWVRAAVSARLGRDPFKSDAASRVEVNISSSTPPALEAQLLVTKENGRIGKRLLDSPSGDCMELASAVELAISLALDPAMRSEKPETVVVAPPAPVVVAAPAPVVAVVAVVEEKKPVAFRVHGALLGTAGAIPGFTGGLLLGGGVAISRFSVSLEARAHLPSGIRVGDRRVSTFLFLGSLVPCVELGVFQGCVVGSLGALQFEEGTSRGSSVMAQAGARVALRFKPTEHIVLSPWLEGAAVLTRTTVSLDGAQLWVTWPVAVSGGLTFEWSISS